MDGRAARASVKGTGDNHVDRDDDLGGELMTAVKAAAVRSAPRTILTSRAPV
ncbi:hypothetical protein GCM10009716_27460 [Streptomyces sodiiphilus]|uniref:Uncharacterized protein n=1 Tax=Streptomyces sodiiphilus TaxID=226217 RepID=A0ABN2PDV0_9ACTN